MSLRCVLAVTAVVLTAATSWLPLSVAGEPPANQAAANPARPEASKVTPPEWTGKVVLLSCGTFAVAFENAQLRTLGGDVYVVGKAVEETFPSPANGRVNWVPLRKAETIIEFASLKEYLKAAANRAAPVPAFVPGVVPVPVPATPS
jgi:hypothetical protein